MSATTPRFDTAQIGPLREILRKFSTLKPSVGDFVCFRVVVDANFVIQELIQHVRYPERGRTALEELMKATVVDVHAPRWLEAEMKSAIPQVATKRKILESDLWERWVEYRALLKWDETLGEPETNSIWQRDPKDLPYIALEKKLSADGILSKDQHIRQMGGHPLTLDFVLSARSYARAAVTTVSIRVFGVLLTAVAMKALAEFLYKIGRSFATLPDPMKALLLLVGIAALVHPGARKWITERCVDIRSAVIPAWEGIMELVMLAADMHKEALLQANDHLVQATGAVRPQKILASSARGTKRRRARITPSTLSANSELVA